MLMPAAVQLPTPAAADAPRPSAEARLPSIAIRHRIDRLRLDFLVRDL